jgi:hypothetical protein
LNHAPLFAVLQRIFISMDAHHLPTNICQDIKILQYSRL